jgi:type IV secretion system protein VirB10
MMMSMRALLLLSTLLPLALPGQTPEAAPTNPPEEKVTYTVDPGTRIPLTTLNSVSTKHAIEGDRVYLETLFPILVKGKIVIPPGSSVAGTVTSLKRPGRVKGRGELYVRFDTLILPNGVSRDFKSRLGSIDGRDNQKFDREEGKIKGEGDIAGDASKIGTAAGAGAGLGTIAGAAGGNVLRGAGIGGAAGAGAMLVGVLLTRGPDVVLAKGSTLELLLDRTLTFEASELEFTGQGTGRRSGVEGGPVQRQNNSTGGVLGRRVPIP